MTLLGAVTPIFGLLLLGFVAVKLRALDGRDVRGLVLFVFNFAIPALLFRSLVGMEPQDRVEWKFLVAFYVGSLLAYAVGMAVGRFGFGRPLRDQAIFGMSSAYSNLVMMGIPVVLTALGPEASLPMLMIIAFHSATFMPLTVALIQADGSRDLPAGRPVGLMFFEILRNPIILGILLGLGARLAGVTVWSGVDRVLELLSSSAVPCALFAMGGSLAAYSLRGDLASTVTLSTVKLAVHPLLVWLFAGPVLGLEGTWLSVPVVLAAMPTAVNTYLFGARYQASPEVAARTVLSSTIASIVTIAVVLALIGARA